MKRIQLDIDEFMSFKQIKPGVVHLHNGMIYKHSHSSEKLVTALDMTKAHPVMKNITIPEAKLYIDNFYFGYAYQFNNKLRQVLDALFLGIIPNEETFILELINIIEELNKLGFCYWDFHKNNIFSDAEGHPFLLDIDDIRTQENNVNRYHQIKYLTEFILNIYLDTDKTLSQLMQQPAIRKYLKDSTIAYIESLIKRNGNINELPFCIIEELSNPYRKELIKTSIK